MDSRSLLWPVTLVLTVLLSISCVQAAQEQPYSDDPRVLAYVDSLVEQYNFDRAALQALFAQTARRDDIIERISRPAEKAWTWSRYRGHLVDEKRIQQGVEFWHAHRKTLALAEQTYGVAPETVLAILGIETKYGRVTGSFPVLDALTTLGFDYPPRAKFFRKELTEFLLLARQEGKDPASLTGSYAGAMGFGQFIPSSYRHYAVDFDGDGVRDIWQNPVDAIGSIANYFAEHRWHGGQLVAVAVTASPEAAALANESLKPKRSVAEWQNLGVTIEADLAADVPAALFKYELEDSFEYWLGLHDFYVITRYNRSHMYALAVYQLSQAIKSRYQTQVAVQ